MIKGLDKKKTTENARDVLKLYGYLDKMLNVDIWTMSEPDERRQYVGNMMKKIKTTVEMMTNRKTREILFDKFIEREFNDWGLMEKHQVNQREFYRLVNRGLLEFAEIYDLGSILVFKHDNIVSRLTVGTPLHK